MPLTLIQFDLLRRITDTMHFGFSTRRLKLSDRRALAALFEQGLVTPQVEAEAKVVATRAGRGRIAAAPSETFVL